MTSAALTLFFVCGGERMAVPASAVFKVVPIEGRTTLPLAPPSLAGIAHHQGRVFTLVDLSFSCFGTVATSSLVMLLEAPHRGYGLLVDSVAEAAPAQLEHVSAGPVPALTHVADHARDDKSMAFALDVDVLIQSLANAASSSPLRARH
jgi:chemotaxis signal transduction protein